MVNQLKFENVYQMVSVLKTITDPNLLDSIVELLEKSEEDNCKVVVDRDGKLSLQEDQWLGGFFAEPLPPNGTAEVSSWSKPEAEEFGYDMKFYIFDGLQTHFIKQHLFDGIKALKSADFFANHQKLMGYDEEIDSWVECELVKRTPEKDLPLLLCLLKSEYSKQALCDKLQGRGANHDDPTL